jgi:hypothetical protein
LLPVASNYELFDAGCDKNPQHQSRRRNIRPIWRATQLPQRLFDRQTPLTCGKQVIPLRRQSPQHWMARASKHAAVPPKNPPTVLQNRNGAILHFHGLPHDGVVIKLAEQKLCGEFKA